MLLYPHLLLWFLYTYSSLTKVCKNLLFSRPQQCRFWVSPCFLEQYWCTADRILYNIRRKIKHIGSREEIKVVVIGTVKGDLHDIGKNYRTASFLY
jgi:hypothetical protein